MKHKLLNFGLIITSLFGYLEWGQDNTAFLFQAEWDVMKKLFEDPVNIIHPFTLIPMFGQGVLISTLLQKKPSRILTYLGIACLGLLMLMVAFIGILETNFKMIGSALPFEKTAIGSSNCLLCFMFTAIRNVRKFF